MRNLLFSLFAIGVAAVAAMVSTTAMLNAPRRTPAADVISENISPADTTAAPSVPRAAAAPDAPPAKPGGTPDAGAGSASGAGQNAAAGEEEADKDPYEGVAPEELPPDMQYSADSSVSFPTNI
jgi:hypothetical protein